MDFSLGPISVLWPLTITSPDQFPDGTEILAPSQGVGLLYKARGMWIPSTAYMVRFGNIDDGCVAIFPDRTTRYIRYASEGGWLLFNPTSEHFSNAGNRRPALNTSNGHMEFVPPQRLDSVFVRSLSQRACRFQEAIHSDPVVFNVPISQAQLGSVDRPLSPAFTGEFAEHQKANVSYEDPRLNRAKRQINIRAPKKGPYTRSKVAHLLARDIERALGLAKAYGEPLLFGGIEVELEDLILRDVRQISSGGIRVGLAFAPGRG